MPECNICRSPWVEGQAYCKSCGTRFSLELPDRGFCSRCGAKLLPHQDKCPECAASLATRPANQGQEADFPWQPPPPARPRLFLYGLLTGFAVLGAIFSVWLLVQGVPGTGTPLGGREAKPATAPVPAVQGVLKPGLQGPAAAAAASEPDANKVLRSQLEALLAGIKDANQKKDLNAFLSAYSPNFAHLAQKKFSTKRIWAKYDFPKMTFKIEDAELLAPGRAFARVSWDIESKNRWTQKLEDATLTYRVWFTKEPAQWQIQALEKESQAGAGDGSHGIVGK